MHRSDHADWLEKRIMTCLLAMNLYVHVCGCVIEEKSDRKRSEFRNMTTHICFSLLSPQRSHKWWWLATCIQWIRTTYIGQYNEMEHDVSSQPLCPHPNPFAPWHWASEIIKQPRATSAYVKDIRMNGHTYILMGWCWQTPIIFRTAKWNENRNEWMF